MMWLVMGIRTLGVQKELQKRVKHSVYHQDDAVIFFDLNFSLKREEPFCILHRSTQPHLNPHNNLECSHEFYGEIILANEVRGSLLF